MAQQTSHRSRRIPLCSRPADLVYFIFFLTHIAPTIIIDGQVLCPEWIMPANSKFRALAAFYVSMTGDPIVGGASGFFGKEVQAQFLWVRCSMWTEILLQLPTFFYGAYNLYYDSNITTLYPLLVAYGAGTAMSTLPCLVALLAAPSPGTDTVSQVALTDWQRALLLGSYIPYFVVPLAISIDMAFRTKRLVAAGLSALQKVD